MEPHAAATCFSFFFCQQHKPTLTLLSNLSQIDVNTSALRRSRDKTTLNGGQMARLDVWVFFRLTRLLLNSHQSPYDFFSLSPSFFAIATMDRKMDPVLQSGPSHTCGPQHKPHRPTHVGRGRTNAVASCAGHHVCDQSFGLGETNAEGGTSWEMIQVEQQQPDHHSAARGSRWMTPLQLCPE